MAKFALSLLTLSLIAVVAPSISMAQCGQGQVIEARQAIRRGCECSGTTGRTEYLACARAVIATEIAQNRLAQTCRSELQRFAAASTCGRPASVTCCVQGNGRPWRGTIRREAAACRAPRNGSSCISSLPHLADACRPETGCNDMICGNGELEPFNYEECEPPGTVSCDALCQFISTCGNGVTEPGEECDGQAYCDGCSLKRRRCCQTVNGCLGHETAGDGMQRICWESMGDLTNGVCEGDTGSCQEYAGYMSCSPGSCVDRPIDPVPLCCEQVDGTCRDTIATTAAAIRSFPCVQSVPPEDGRFNRLVAGACGDDGLCAPAN